MRITAVRPLWTHAVTLGVGLLLLFAAGCAEKHANAPLAPEPIAGAAEPDPTGGGTPPDPAQPQPGPFTHMPLELGRVWDYVIVARTRVVFEGTPDQVTTTVASRRVEVTNMARFLGQEYFMLAEYDPTDQLPGAATLAMREDLQGLYSFDLYLLQSNEVRASSVPPGWVEAVESSMRTAAEHSPHRRAIEAAAERLGERLKAIAQPALAPLGIPGHPGLPVRGSQNGFRRGRARPHETTQLVYPLARDVRWIVRDSPHVEMSVEGRERLRVPAGDFQAWRLSTRNEFMREQDRAHFWYATDGLVQSRVHLEGQVPDPEGNLTGVLIADIFEVRVLVPLPVFPD